MHWRPAIVLMFLLGTSATPAAHAAAIPTYALFLTPSPATAKCVCCDRTPPLNTRRQQHRDPRAVSPILESAVLHEITLLEENSDKNIAGSRDREHEVPK